MTEWGEEMPSSLREKISNRQIDVDFFTSEPNGSQSSHLPQSISVSNYNPEDEMDFFADCPSSKSSKKVPNSKLNVPAINDRYFDKMAADMNGQMNREYEGNAESDLLKTDDMMQYMLTQDATLNGNVVKEKDKRSEAAGERSRDNSQRSSISSKYSPRAAVCRLKKIKEDPREDSFSRPSTKGENLIRMASLRLEESPPNERGGGFVSNIESPKFEMKKNPKPTILNNCGDEKEKSLKLKKKLDLEKLKKMYLPRKKSAALPAQPVIVDRKTTCEKPALLGHKHEPVQVIKTIRHVSEEKKKIKIKTSGRYIDSNKIMITCSSSSNMSSSLYLCSKKHKSKQHAASSRKEPLASVTTPSPLLNNLFRDPHLHLLLAPVSSRSHRKHSSLSHLISSTIT